jgi:hypothetical protein
MKRLAYVAAAILPLLLGLALQAQQPCAPSHLQSAAQRVNLEQRTLLSFRVDILGEQVTPQTAAQIAAFKRALAAAVYDWMVCRASSRETAPALQHQLALWLDANQPGKPTAGKYPADENTVAGIYGADLHIVVDHLNSSPEFLGIVAGFNISCGDDHLLMLFERKEHRWQRVLLWQSGRYQEISGAFGDFFEYLLLPPSVAGGWDVAAAHGTPWCTSRFSGFRIDVLRISQHGQPSHLLFQKAGAYSRGDSRPVLSPAPGGFQLRVATNSLDTRQFVKTSIFRYRIHDGHVHRVQPVATTPVGFVDSWLQASWTAASQWSATRGLASLHRLHTAFATPSHANSDFYSQFTYRAVRGCSAPSQVQVQLEETFARQEKITSSAQIYFLLEKHEDHFLLLSASSHPNPSCTGPNLLHLTQ